MRTTLAVLALVLSSAAIATSRTRFTRYRSWNSRMYPVWRDGDPRYRDCWKGGEVTFDIRNDAPTLTGSKTTFSIDVRPPQNQTVLPDGQVVWARNCTVNGTQYTEGQPVYPEPNTPQEWTGVFPDGTPFTTMSTRKPWYIFVWKTWGRYWQVADGPSSSLTIGTDNVPLGSYSMEVVIYHCRGKDKFVPLGYASTQFSITDQIPFSVTLSQIGDVNQADQNFIQNRPVLFSISLHDPSQYLTGSDITFNWDFGDNSGTLISREPSVAHTYLSAGSFRPQVVLTAAIQNGCDPNPTLPPAPGVATTGAPVVDPSVGPAEAMLVPSLNPPVLAPTAQGDIALAVPGSEAPSADDVALAASPEPAVPAVEEGAAASAAPEAGDDLAVVPAEVEGAVVAEDPAGETATVATVDAEQAADDLAVIDAAASIAPPVEEEEGTVLPEAPAVDTEAVAVDTEAVAVDTAVAEVPADADTGTVAPAADVVITMVATDAPVVEVVPSVVPSVVPAVEGEVVETVNEAATEEAANTETAANEATAAAPTISPAPQNGVVAEVEAETEAAQVALVIAKRQAPELAAEGNCMVYRYGSFSTTLDVVQGIESVEIVEVSNVAVLATEVEQNAVDLTITCQGSLPNEVCTVVSDADCASPVQTVCNTVTPTNECQMILRQFFNNSGTFCINVSLTNDVSFAVASARVSVTVDSGSTAGGTATAILGVLVLVCIVGGIALTYRRFKQYHPLREESDSSLGNSGWTSVPMLLWNLLSRQSTGESRPLLQGRVV
ncbi:premelanosome protein a isoform X2 [Salminus brasiliensis]|uniref:premelanosome protein a isoform X2 n=1 Tax=Salminus brasiliensis TaxID=930266 RepID=UPI003B8359B9